MHVIDVKNPFKYAKIYTNCSTNRSDVVVGVGVTMQYRADIDGLRGVAVLLVIAYHAGLDRISGGFVGVDVFFVISGYLIGSIILDDVRHRRFSFAEFYERRVRRLLPALSVVLLVTLLLGTIYSMPPELEEIGRTVLAALTFSSNIYFWRNSDYFDTPALYQPLLHTWSLAIEEQFYVIAPILLVALARYAPRYMKAAVLGATALSLLLCIGLTPRWTAASFYLLPTRAWELLLGMSFASGALPELRSRWTAQAAGIIGAVMIASAALLFSDEMRFPGAAALLPSVGALLIIASGKRFHTIVSRILATRLIVFVGLISYSLYLWHWPLLVIQRTDAIFTSTGSEDVQAALAVAAAFALAILSWRYVEQPFRSRTRYPLPKLAMSASVAATGLAAFSIAIWAADGLPGRLSPKAQAAAAMLEYDPTEQYRVGECMISAKFSSDDFNQQTCLGKSATQPNYLLMGDSHAAHLWHGLQTEMPQANIMQLTASGCRPLLHGRPEEWVECRRLMNRVFENPSILNGVDKLILAGRWMPGEEIVLGDTLAWAKRKGVKVVLIGPVVQYQRAVPRIIATSIQLRQPDLLAKQRLTQLFIQDSNLSKLAATNGASHISLIKLMCAYPSCLAHDGRFVPLQFDYGHLTARGSAIVARAMKPKLE